VPAVDPLELAADQGVVAHPRQGVGIGHRIDVHAVFRQRNVQPSLGGMPQQGSRLAVIAISACRWPSGWPAAGTISWKATRRSGRRPVNSPAAVVDDENFGKFGGVSNRE